MNGIRKMRRTVDRFSTIVSYISFFAIIAMMLLITADVLMRKLFNAPITGSYEIVQYIQVVVVFASFGYTQTLKMHVRVTLFSGLLHWRVRTVLNGLWELICAAGAGVCGYAGFVQAKYLMEKGFSSDVLKFPLYPFYYFEGVMMFIFALIILADGIRYFAAAGDKEYAHETFKDYS